MYAAVRSWPAGRSTVSRFATAAARYGYDGLVLRNHVGEQPPANAVQVPAGIETDVVMGIELRGETPAAVSGTIRTHRQRVPVLCLHGGTDRLNRFGVSQERIDVLSHPLRDGGRINHVLAKEAARNGVRIEVDLSRVLRERDGRRVTAIDGITGLFEVLDHYETPYVVSATPRSHLELRTPRELAALGETIGLDPEWITEGLEEWGRIAARNRKTMDESFIEPGVQRLEREPAETTPEAMDDHPPSREGPE